MRNIHVVWEGPISLRDALNLKSSSDYGLYQYYGCHPMYGYNTLLYVGKAQKQTFGARIVQHNWEVWSSGDIELYVGRIHSVEPLDENEWENQIDLAERIILQSHTPSFNSSNLNTIGYKGEDIRVLNWGKRRLLLPEVSISRWEGLFAVGNKLNSTFLQQKRNS